MQIAVQCELTVGPVKQIVEDGQIVGNNSGLFLVRRLLDLYPGLRLIDSTADSVVECDGFSTGPVRSLDPTEDLVISMDLLASQAVRYRLQVTPRIVPKVMNFFWANVSDQDYAARPDRLGLAASAACFPTFANSRKTENDLIRVIEENLTVKHVRKAVLGSAPLGIEVDKIPERESEPDGVPVVLYPGIYVMGRKRPLLWLEVMDMVAAATEVQGRVRISHRHAEHPSAEEFRSRSYVDSAPQDKQAVYYESLKDVSVVFGTSQDESYGLAFMEAMVAGAVPVFPDIDWAYTLVGRDWPLLFRTKQEAYAQLRWAVQNLDDARALMVEHGLTREKLRVEHSSDVFFARFDEFAREQFPRLSWT